MRMLRELPEEIGNVTNLRELRSWNCERLGSLPLSMWRLKNLEILMVDFTDKMLKHTGEIFPSQLKALYITNFVYSAASPALFGKLKCLRRIYLSQCEKDASDRPLMKNIFFQSLQSCPFLGDIRTGYFDEELNPTEEEKTKLEVNLRLNRLRFRLRKLRADLWPYVLSNPDIALEPYSFPCHGNPNPDPGPYFRREQWVYLLLLDHSDSIVSLLLTRKEN